MVNVITYREGNVIITALTDIEYTAVAHRATALAARGAAGEVPGASLAAGSWHRDHVVGILHRLLPHGPVVQVFGAPDSIGFEVAGAEGLERCACTGEAFWAAKDGAWGLTFLPDGSVLLLGAAVAAVGPKPGR